MLTQPGSEQDHNNILEQGFTLIELLIVVIILGILAAVVIFAVGNLTSSAQKNACATEALTVDHAMQGFKAANPTSTLGGAAPTQEKIVADLTQTALVAPHVAAVTNVIANGALLQAVPKDYNANGGGYWDWNNVATTGPYWRIVPATYTVTQSAGCLP